MHDFYAIDISRGSFVQRHHIVRVVVFEFKAVCLPAYLHTLSQRSYRR
jgi:hypothetical protein